MTRNAPPSPGQDFVTTTSGFLPLRRGEAPLVAASVLGLGLVAVIAVATGGNEFLFYIAVVAVLMVVVTLIHRRYPLSLAMLWALWIWAALHMAGGLVPMAEPTGVLYNWWLIPERLKFDQVVHAYGFGVTAWVCWRVMMQWGGWSPSQARQAIPLTAAALAAMGFGALNEVIEFTATKLVANTNVGGYENNAWDLVFNMTGAILSVVAIRTVPYRKASPGHPPRQPLA